jgi:hypothetical protein
MEFQIRARALQHGWTICITDPAGNRLTNSSGEVIADRLLVPGKDKRSGLTYPLLPEQDLAALPDQAPHRTLCADASTVARSHEQLICTHRSDTKVFGRYLFELLIGAQNWSELHRLAGNQSIELGLSMPLDDSALQRLPWELMHNGRMFLAQEGQVAILRRIDGPATAVPSMHSPPRVLFVVGTELNNEVIQSGTEYLRLLQALRVANLSASLQTRLLIAATYERTEAALRDFQPDVVHFICHGFIDQSGKCYIELMDSHAPHQPRRLYLAALIDLLQAGGERQPRVVVLSACYSANASVTEVGQVAVPLAAQLVEAGIPLAVGMAGPITDQACRLFARRFYESLLTGGDLAHATAAGRRAAIRGGGVDPENSADWSMPTLFVSQSLQGSAFNVQRRDVDQRWHAIADDVGPGPFPAFCDRLQTLEQFDLLLADDASQKSAPGGRERQVLSIASLHPDDKKERYGRTWLLKELAAKTFRDGHVACLLDRETLGPTDDWPKTIDALGAGLCIALRSTLDRFATAFGTSFQEPASLATEFYCGQGLPIEHLPIQVRKQAGPLDVLAAAFTHDARQVLAAARSLKPGADSGGMKLVVLIDDVHRMGVDAVTALARVINGTMGLRSARTDVRTVLAHSTRAIAGQEPTIDAIVEWIRGGWIHKITLEGFKTPQEEQDAYKHFLLNWHKDGAPLPLTVSSNGNVNTFFKVLRDRVRGIPSLLVSTEALTAVDVSLEYAQLTHAKDEDLLKRALTDVREAP